MTKSRKVRELSGENLDSSIRDYSHIRHITIFDDYNLEMELTGYFENPLDPFLNEVNGFGYKKNITSFYLGTREIVSEEETQLNDLTGTLLFYSDGNNGSAYTQMNNFKLAMGLSNKLFIRYTIPYEQTESIVEFYPELTCEVKLINESYGEIDEKTSMIEMEVTFKRLTPWKSNVRQNDVINNATNNGTRNYEINDSYTYNEQSGTESPVYGAAGVGQTKLNIFGTATSYPKITIYGPTTNPDILITDVFGNIVKHLVITGSFSETDVIVIDSDPSNLSFTLNGTNNIYPQVRKGNGYDSYLGLKPGKYNVTYGNGLSEDAGNVVISCVWEYL